MALLMGGADIAHFAMSALQVREILFFGKVFGDPLTRPVPAGESAGLGPPSPSGEGRVSITLVAAARPRSAMRKSQTWPKAAARRYPDYLYTYFRGQYAQPSLRPDAEGEGAEDFSGRSRWTDRFRQEEAR